MLRAKQLKIKDNSKLKEKYAIDAANVQSVARFLANRLYADAKG